MSTDKIEIFITWLDAQEEARGWTDYRLAMEAKINPSVLSRARNDGVLPKWDACMAISNALNISPITVFRNAGLLPPGNDEISFEDWQYLLVQMTPDERDEVMQIVTMKIERRKKAEGLKTLNTRKAG